MKAGLASAGAPDPIFAQITEAFRLLTLCDEAFAAHERPGSNVTWDDASDVQELLVTHCQDVLLMTPPSTFEGGAALADFAVAWVESQGVPLALDEHGISILRLIAAPLKSACGNQTFEPSRSLKSREARG
jgi:hypothetical protein